MKKLIRAGVALAACATALAVSSSALAALNPTFSVGISSQKGVHTLAIDARAGKGPDNDWVARMQVYVPSGFKASTPPAGTQVGTVIGQSIATQISDTSFVRFKGLVNAIALNDPNVMTAAQGCDTGTHTAAWMVKGVNEANGNVWRFPIFLDQTTGTETQLGAMKLVICFGPRTDLEPNGDGNKLVSMTLNLTQFVMPSKAGDYKWHSLWTPFAADLKSLYDAGTVETQSTVSVGNAVLTIAAKKRDASHYVLSGKLLLNGEAMDGVKVAVKHGPTAARLVSMAVPKTSSNGTWTVNATVKKLSYFQAGATLGKKDLGASACTAAFSSPCVDATIGGAAVVSRVIRVH